MLAAGVVYAVKSLQIVLAQRPAGEPVPADFRLEEVALPPPGDGEVLVQTRWLSLDPYMRGRMSAVRSYAPPVEIGKKMVGETVGVVIESRAPGFVRGELVAAHTGWSTHAVVASRDLRRIHAEGMPASYALGVLGMPGLTAYCALLEIGAPKAGETVVVSAASGAVGSVAGQVAKIKGCRVIGIAGSDEKCRYVEQILGFDACINRRTENLDDALARTAPGGIDVYFDNTAGSILEAVLRRINLHARIALVGLIESYNAQKAPNGPNLAALLVKRAKIEGFLVMDHADHRERFEREMTQWLREGRVRYKEDVVDGLENAPHALIGLLRGENFGKLLVRIGEP